MPCRGGVCTPKKQNKPRAMNPAIQPMNPTLNPIAPGQAVPSPTGQLPQVQQPGQYGMQPLTVQQPDQSWSDWFKSIFAGTPAQTMYFPSFMPHQQNILDQLLQRGFQGLPQQSLDFEPIAERARREFQTETVPSLAERFTSLGGGQRSSAFQGALGRAGSDLESQLAALRSKYGLLAQGQQFQQAFPQIQAGLQPRFENVFTPRQPSAISNLGTGLAQGAGYAIPLLAKAGLGL